MADFAFGLLAESHVGYQIEVRGYAKPLVRPNVEIVLVSPIRSLILLETVEAIDPIHFLFFLIHVWFYHLLETLPGILVHGEGEVVPAVFPGGEAPGGGIGGEKVGGFPFLHPFLVSFTTSVTPVETADTVDFLVVAVFFEQLFAIGEEIISRHSIVKQDDALFLLFEKPFYSGGNHLGFPQMIVLP